MVPTTERRAFFDAPIRFALRVHVALRRLAFLELPLIVLHLAIACCATAGRKSR
jgi:hypothetical protein